MDEKLIKEVIELIVQWDTYDEHDFILLKKCAIYIISIVTKANKRAVIDAIKGLVENDDRTTNDPYFSGYYGAQDDAIKSITTALDTEGE